MMGKIMEIYNFDINDLAKVKIKFLKIDHFSNNFAEINFRKKRM